MKIGDKVCSVGGCFVEGTVEKVEVENEMEVVTVRWTKHNTKGVIDFVQKRSSDICRLI